MLYELLYAAVTKYPTEVINCVQFCDRLLFIVVMLFLDEPRLNVTRLHRILKNLGYHSDTLLWIIRALISILMKTNESKDKPTSEVQ